MHAMSHLTDRQAEQLRCEHYNAEVVELQQVHEDLVLMRVRPDRGVPHFTPGQYTVLALGNWEPRVPGVQDELPEATAVPQLIKRAYSISCPLLDDQGELVRAHHAAYLEFYITLVRRGTAHPPALTPRLFQLQVGDRLFCGPHMHGNYSLRGVRPDDAVVFLATGTGEAPHNAMLVELLARGHAAPILSATCVRYRRDLAYLATHRVLEDRFPNYHYVPLTTREPENLDASHPDFAGKRYLQDYFQSGDLEQELGREVDPHDAHFFLCGSPDMIGVPRRTHDPQKRYPSPKGMVELLERRGFEMDQPHHRGTIHFEKYW